MSDVPEVLRISGNCGEEDVRTCEPKPPLRMVTLTAASFAGVFLAHLVYCQLSVQVIERDSSCIEPP